MPAGEAPRSCFLTHCKRIHFLIVTHFLIDCAATTAPVHTKNVAIMGWSALNDRTFSTYFREKERRRVLVYHDSTFKKLVYM